MDIRYYAAFLSEWLGVISVVWLLSLNPRFKTPQIGFKYARRDGIIALSLFALLLVFASIYYSTNQPALPAVLNPAPAPIIDLKQAAFVAALGLAAVLVSLLFRRQPLRSIGWNQDLLRIGLQLGIAMAILTVFLRNRVMDMLSGVNSTELSLLLLALGIAVAEETIFRGFIQLRLVWWLGVWQGIVLTAIFFTLWHTPTWISLPIQTQFILMGLTLVQGLVLGWIMHKSGHIAAPILYRAISIWLSFLFLA